MKYKVGDRVKVKSLDWYNENKTIHGDIWFDNAVFVGGQSLYCGCELTIRLITNDNYYVIENDYYWTDEMIECKVEEETKFGTALNPLEIKSNANCLTQEKVDETKPKFKVGDKITNGKDKLLILNIVSDKYIVEDNLGECGTVYFNTQNYWKLVEEKTSIKLTGKAIKNNEMVVSVDEYTLPEGYIFKDENGNVINATKIVLEKKKKEYPKTYEECAEIMNCPIAGPSGWLFNFDVNIKDPYYRKIDILMGKFTRLLICRDAYWKLYGDEMGLEKPWKPDWTNQELLKYCIANVGGKIKTSERYIVNTILAFPTIKMRDAFYENFKDLIEDYKELL